MVSAPLCGECLDGWRVDPDTLLPVDRCPCRHRNATPAQARDAGMGATVEANPAAMQAALRIVRDAALARPELSSNDVRTEMRLAQIPVGYVTSTDVGTHSHPVRSYESRIYRLGRTAS
jgi:hypothetical protein